MLRPATPLSVIFFFAFVLLLISTLSTPVIKSIPLGSFEGFNFGVLGYCKGDVCVGPRIGYPTEGLFGSSQPDDNWDLPSTTRSHLTSILVVHPIAAFLTLICFCLACAAHFHGPSHSPRYLLALLILTFPTLLVTLLAFLVDILLFVPHMSWGGWIVLGATILIIASSIVTCAMRRTLVSRKARKKRIEENADMNGANYYHGLAQQRVMTDAVPRADSPPPFNGIAASDKDSHFAAFEMNRQDTHESQQTGGSFDDRVPLNQPRNPSIRSASTGGVGRPFMRDENAPPMPRRATDSPNGMLRRPSRDQYGNPIAPGADMGVLRHENSQGSLGSNRSNGYSQRGRGGYGPPPRGYGPPRGGFGPPRGGFGPPRGAFGPRGGRGGYGPPPPGWRGRGGYGSPPPGMMGRGGPPPRQGPPPDYEADAYYGAPRSSPPPPMHQPMPMPDHDQFVAGPSLPIGQAIELDERSGAVPRQRQDMGNGSYGLRDSDADIAGMVDLQQGHHEGRSLSPIRQTSSPEGRAMSPASLYSDPTYRPPRRQWSPDSASLGLPQHDGLQSQSELATQMSGGLPDMHSSTPMASSPVLPASPTASTLRGPKHHRAGSASETYYEDVDPRFAEDTTPGDYHPMAPGPHGNARDSGIPTLLTPGPGQFIGRMQSPPSSSNHLNPEAYATHGLADHSNSSSSIGGVDRPESETSQGLEPIPRGARSPGEGSETSHYTSISQRPINPNWRPGPGGMPPPGMPPAYGGSSASAVQRRRDDVILNANPDFSLPGVGLPARGRGRGRGGAASLSGGALSAANTGLTPPGRYPMDI